MSGYVSTTLTLNFTSTAVVSNVTSATVTISTADYPDATVFITTALRGGGIKADSGIFYPSSSIANVVVTGYN